jgi:hypothetical protein
MKRLQSAVFVVVLGLVSGVPLVGHAFLKVELIWTATTGSGTPGSRTITASPGDQITGQIRVTPDATGVLAYSVSLLFDSDLSNELNLINVTENLPPGMEYNLAPGVNSTLESTPGTPGGVFSMEAVCLSCDGPTAGTLVAGTVTFQVTANVANDGDDVLTGTFNDASDGLANNALLPIEDAVFVSAVVNAGPLTVPALPHAGMLVAAATILLGALWMLGRGRLAIRH